MINYEKRVDKFVHLHNIRLPKRLSDRQKQANSEGDRAMRHNMFLTLLNSLARRNKVDSRNFGIVLLPVEEHLIYFGVTVIGNKPRIAPISHFPIGFTSKALEMYLKNFGDTEQGVVGMINMDGKLKSLKINDDGELAVIDWLGTH